MWHGDIPYVLTNLILKDFRVRYRNMSLGVLWSVLNPLVMMGVLTFVFTRVFPSTAVKYPFALFVLCGIIPFNFFSMAWSTATMSIVDNGQLIKRVAMPREIIPIAVVLANCLHLAVQIGLLLLLILVFGSGFNRHWVWLPVIWVLYIVFVCGAGLISSALDVYLRDMRYVVESANTMLFWLVPIFYPFDVIAERYQEIYQYNPVAAIVMAMRNILLEARPPAWSLLRNLTVGSFVVFVIGWFVFQKLERRFYNYL